MAKADLERSNLRACLYDAGDWISVLVSVDTDHGIE